MGLVGGQWEVRGNEERRRSEGGMRCARVDARVACDPRVRVHVLGCQLVSRLEPEAEKEGTPVSRRMFGGCSERAAPAPGWIGPWRALTLTGSMSGNPLCATTLPAYATHASSASPSGRVIENNDSTDVEWTKNHTRGPREGHAHMHSGHHEPSVHGHPP